MVSALLLFTIGIILIILNFRAIKKEKNSFNNILINSERDMRDYDVEIGKFRREFSETILELQREIENLKDEVNKNKSNQDSNDKLNKTSNDIKNKVKLEEKIGVNIDIKDEEIDHTYEYINEEKENKKSDSNNSINVSEIYKMIENGMSIDEIAEETSMGKGELLLIKELYKN